MAAKSSPGGFVVATVTNPGSFMATITHPTGNGYCRDRILRDRPPHLKPSWTGSSVYVLSGFDDACPAEIFPVNKDILYCSIVLLLEDCSDSNWGYFSLLFFLNS